MPEFLAALPQYPHIDVNLTIGRAIKMNGDGDMIGQTNPTINPDV